MSKYKAYGKGRGNSRAGLQFDKLIKACSNSKKPPTAMAAGALGRFGVAQFTSTRGSSCLDSTGEDYEQEKPSRFSSLHKRARMEGSVAPSLVHHHLEDPIISSHYPLHQAPPALTPAVTHVMKPRKFFKSRGPMEVEVTGGGGVHHRPELPLPPYTPYTQPILGSNQANIQQPHPPPTPKAQIQGAKVKGKRGRPPKNKDKVSALASPLKKVEEEGKESFSSPPIKLKIIKDKATSTFVSVAESSGAGSSSSNNKEHQPLPPLLKAKRERKNSVKEQVKKEPGRRGRPPKNQNPATAAYQPPAQLKGEKGAVAEGPKRSSGRITRASIKYKEKDSDDDDEEEEDEDEEEEDEEEEEHSQNQNMAPINYPLYQNQHKAHAQPQPPVVVPGGPSSSDTLKKLEEDAEFQKLSQMLSSMEQEEGHGQGHQSHHPQNSQNQEYSQNQNQNFHQNQNSSYESSSMSSGGGQEERFFQANRPVQREKEERTDIRSILEDDWNVTFEEESPRKGQSSSQSQSQSPPKVSRFDPSAFMPDGQPLSPEEEEPRQRQHHSPVDSTPSTIQRPIPLYPQGNQNSSFNINSSPYSMKNLLGKSSQIMSQNSEDSEELDSGLKSESQSQGESSEMDVDLDLGGDSQGQGSQESLSADSQTSPSKNAQALPVASTAPKKASIFKSRASKSDQAGKGTKAKAVYKHTFGQMDKGEGAEEAKTQHHPPGTTLFEEFEDFEEQDDPSGEPTDLNLRKMRIGGEGASPGSDSGEDSAGNKVLCKKKVKKLFTVVRNVKAGHELQESGEFHEFDGDIWYILEDLKDKNPINSRCLSAVTLASRCMDQAFRMHLRAHGTVAEFCKELHDAPSHPILSLLAATVLFVLSQDRLNMDLDTESLKLILALTKSDLKEEEGTLDAEVLKNRQRVVQLCSEMKARGHAKHLQLEKLTASELALETLLYLTSKRAGEWVKHELRTLGGLDSIVGEVQSSFNFVRDAITDGNWGEVVMERLRKIDRCLEVLGQVTFNHEDNQRYLMQVSTREVEGSSEGVKCTPASPTVFFDMFQFCKEFLVKASNSQQSEVTLEQCTRIREILFLVLRLLVNLSHDYRGIVLGSEIMMGIPGFLELSLHSVFEMTSHFPDEKVFDLLMHSLCLLLNLVEISHKNRRTLLQTTIRKNGSSGTFSISGRDSSFSSDDSGVEDELPLLDALVHMFLSRERSAKKEEQHTDNILTTGEKKGSQNSNKNSQKDSQASSQGDTEGSSLQDTIDKLIQTAGKHMENSLIAAYLSLLIAFLVMDDLPFVDKVREMMPGNNFLSLMIVLKKLFNFMSITSSASGSTRGLKATSIALKFYAKVDPPSAEELKKIIPE